MEFLFQFLFSVLTFVIFYASLRKLRIFGSFTNVSISMIASFYVLFALLVFQEIVMKLVALLFFLLLLFFGAVLLFKGFFKKRG